MNAENADKKTILLTFFSKNPRSSAFTPHLHSAQVSASKKEKCQVARKSPLFDGGDFSFKRVFFESS